MKQTRPFLALVGLCLLGFNLPLNAQITVTNTTFPALGDMLRFVFDNNPVGDPNSFITPPGNQNWDFSNLAEDFTQIRSFTNPATGTGTASFPSANLLYVNGGVEYYLNVSSQSVQLLGTYGPDPVGLGVIAAIPNNPPIVEQRSSVNFFDINQISSGVLLGFLPSQMNPILLQQLLSGLMTTPDSLRFRIATNRLDVVDGYGNLTIPGGTFPVLREKRTTYTERRLDAKIPPLGWLDVTDVAVQALNLNTLGVDTTVAFHFFNNVSKEPIAILTLDNSQSQVVSVQYKQTASVPNPMITSIDDGDADDIGMVGTMLTYTITFNEDIDATTVTAADFDNAGTATISIGTITETMPGVFTVQVTPTSEGTLILRIPTGAVIADLDGNNLVVPVSDETTICIPPAGPPPSPPSITNQPQNATVVENATASFSVTATGIGTLSYNWEVLPAGGINWVDVDPALDGNSTLMFSPSSITFDGNQYRVVITDNGSPTCIPTLTSTISDPATLTVQPLTVQPSPVVDDASPTNFIVTLFLLQTQNPPEIFDPCTCRNNTGIIPNGTSTDDGLFDDEIIVVSPTTGDTWEISSGSVFPFATNANPLAQPGDLTRLVPGAPLSYIGSVNTIDGMRYIYRLQIIHKDNEGYNVSVTSDKYPGLILPISNRCFYPTPAINGLDATYCVEQSAVTLMGTVDRGDGQTAATPTSAVFSINNNPVTEFNPQTLGAGAFTVVYTVDAAAEGETIPGCVQAVSQEVQVGPKIAINPLMSQAICSTKKIALADVFKGLDSGNPADLDYTWTIKETVGDNGMLSGLSITDANAGMYMPGKDAVSRGFVTLVLIVNNPDDVCASVSAEVRIIISNVDCGAFPWNGN